MSTILAVDTTSDYCCVVLSHHNKAFHITSDTKNSHADTLLSLVDHVLNKANITLKTLDVIGLVVGPGSFTGIRIGLSMVQALAYGLSLPIVSINKLELLAQIGVAALATNKADQGLIIVATDASMGDVFWQAFEYKNNPQADKNQKKLTASTPPNATKIEQAQCLFEDSYSHADIIGDAFTKQKVTLTNQQELVFSLDDLCLQLLYLSEQKHQQDKALNAFEVEPLYVRTQITWKKRERIRDFKK